MAEAGRSPPWSRRQISWRVSKRRRSELSVLSPRPGGHEEALIISDAEIALFAAASLDTNPLHLDEAYARRTPYGQRVSYGILAALACFGRLKARSGFTLARVSIDFQRPVFPNVSYCLEIHEEEPDRATLRLRDGTALLLRAKVSFHAGVCEALAPGAAVAGRSDALDLSERDIAPGDPITGRCSPGREALEALSTRYGLDERGIPQLQVSALLLASYVVGMEIPGKRALFAGATLDFEPSVRATEPWLEYRGSVEDCDALYGLVTLQLAILSGGPVARGTLQAFLRPEPPAIHREALAARLPPGESLRGKVAVVIGGSRGLGGAISLGLALKGCRVIASFHQAKAAAEALSSQATAAATSGAIIPRQLDAGDPVALEVLRNELADGIDFLICSASPPVLALPFDSAGLARINAFIASAVSLVSAPLAVLSGLLASRRGVVVVISSAYVRDPKVEWPHYVAAKGAIEGLTRTAALADKRIGYLIVRPPRLLTDMTNTPLGRRGALPAEWAAATIVQRLLSAPVTGDVELLEDFPKPEDET